MTQQYREVKRKANAGERIKNVVAHIDLPIGYEATVGRIDCDGDAVIDDMAGDTRYLAQHRYVVLEPVKTQRPSYDELAMRVSELERKVSVLERHEPAKAATSAPSAKKALTRDEIVEKAKADVTNPDKFTRTKIPNDCVNFWPHVDGRRVSYTPMHRVSFSIRRDKRTVVAIIKNTIDGTVTRGTAKCAPDECFNVHIGKAIALRRALGLTVPEEYVKAPQPTEPRVGDVIYSHGRNRTVYAVRPQKRTYGKGAGQHFSGAETGLTYIDESNYEYWRPISCVKIIDDSRVKDGE